MRPPTSSRAFFRIYPFVQSRGFAVSIQPSFIRISEDAERHSLKWSLQLQRNLRPNAIKADTYVDKGEIMGVKIPQTVQMYNPGLMPLQGPACRSGLSSHGASEQG